MIRIAEQHEINEFYMSSILNNFVGPYISDGQYQSVKDVSQPNWSDVSFINDDKNCIGTLIINRKKENEITISLFNLDPDNKKIITGRMIHFMMDYIKRFNPRRVITSAHATNYRSIKLNTHIFGEPVARIPRDYWDNGIYQWVDSIHWVKDLR
jgi:RimJ/RimL family protein N-acetyltransferase